MRWTLVSLLLLSPFALNGGVIEVTLKLPLKPKLAITGAEKIGVAPFIVVAEDGDTRRDRSAKVDLQTEFSRFLRKQLAKETKLKVENVEAGRPPTSDFKELSANRDHWRDLARRSGSDYIVSGVIDFHIEDKAGYRTEEYVSPIDGRTYFRQVLIESTGFVFDIVFAVFDGETGEKLMEENFRDFKEFDQRNYDEILGLFENLRSLESQLLGLFVARETSATRYLFTN
ncbi:MAG TPA: hypothetical protein VMT00_01750 [Thermoanaerobaculia bacterium]|nr:hypothetical protein [Thermoanaerobaculia bacterium]